MRLRRTSAVFIALALAGGLAACGDDDDDAATTDTTGGATATTEAVHGADSVDVTMQEYSYTISGDLKPGGTIRLSNAGKQFHMMGLLKLKEGKTVADVVTALQQEGPGGGGEEGGPTTTAGASGATTTTAATTSGPSTTAAGSGENEGEGDPFAELGEEVGAPAGIMGPGQKAEITAPDFGEGNYTLICFLPTEGGGPPHFAQGMVGELKVAGDKAAEPTADATFKVEPGKAVAGPSTLTAGRHVFKFEAVGTGEAVGQLEPGLAKLDQGKTVADINRAFAAFESDDDNFVLPVNAAATIPGQLVIGLFDLHDASEVYVAVDLTAGTYGIDAHDTDPDDAPLDPVEKTTFTVT